MQNRDSMRQVVGKHNRCALTGITGMVGARNGIPAMEVACITPALQTRIQYKAEMACNFQVQPIGSVQPSPNHC